VKIISIYKQTGETAVNTSFNFRQIRSIFGSAALIALTVLSFALVPESARMQNQIVPRIAFDRDGQVRTINADGSAQTALADGFDPAWSPDGAKSFTHTARKHIQRTFTRWTKTVPIKCS
jgi:hypothetical protein